MKEEFNKKQGIYIELDALLDTRLSTLYSLKLGKVYDDLSGQYFYRRTDTFEGIDKDTFDKAYLLRDKVTLSNSIVTKTIGFIRELILKMSSQAIKTPFHSGPKLIINTYPYDLNELEINSIVEGVAYSTKLACDIEAVSITYEDLTPTYCKNTLSYMFMYDYVKWIAIQIDKFKDLPCPEIMVIAPGIYFTKEPTKEQLNDAIQTFMHPLRAMEFVSSYYIDLKLYDIDLFCASVKVQNEEKT